MRTRKRQSRDIGNIGHTRHVTKTNTTKKTKIMSNTDLTKNRGWTHEFVKGKQFLLLIRHPRVAHIIKSWLIPLCANKYIFRSPYQKDRWALAITCSISSVNLSNLNLLLWNRLAKWTETLQEAFMEDHL